ncbi:MAG: type I pullulanase [Saprospiraceae bacterium]|nr:type I pullulanase [Saprospiraceae bacterium]
MKKHHVFLFTFLFAVSIMTAQNNWWAGLPTYEGSDLGLTYTPQYSDIKVWSPIAQEVTLRFYKNGTPTADNADLIETVKMTKGDKGVWSHRATGNRAGQFYTVQVTTLKGQTMKEAVDIYAKAVGTNGLRAAVVDLNATHPKGWLSDKSPEFKQKTDAILYELHVRDASIAANSGITNKGKFLGLTEKKTFYTEGGQKIKTGLSHIADLGVTHVHLLPSYDFFTVDESKVSDPNYKKYNWGYDPLNYNVPEGSYSTNPADPAVRIREFKALVQAMHKAGLRVVMDVVYNHTMFGEESYFHQIVPNYYHRQTADGKWSNASACGNETASDRPMMRKFMLESLEYWVKEYHIDGFRFDLMGIHDIETMNLISKRLHDIKPDIILYGEGWTAGDSPLPPDRRAVKQLASQFDRIAAFSDDMRDGLKGWVFEAKDRGFVSGHPEMEETVKLGIVGATKHPQVAYNKARWTKEAWAGEPHHCINYAECHDNHTLWDRFLNSNPQNTEGERIKMHKLAIATVLTSQGIPFIHAGMEFLRTKNGEENSFDKPDDINQIDWARKAKYLDVYNFYKGMIALRKAHPAFRMATTAEIQKHLQFIKPLSFDSKVFVETPNVIMYTLDGKAVGDKWQRILVILNGHTEGGRFKIPAGKWRIVVDGDKVDLKSKRDFKGDEIIVQPISATILVE